MNYSFISDLLIFFLTYSDMGNASLNERVVITYAAKKNVSKQELGNIELLLFQANFITRCPNRIEDRFVNFTPGTLTSEGIILARKLSNGDCSSLFIAL
ncbi:hypothetical protein LM596_08180 [Liquorilactobacillus mali]|uniref:hypothetical protein n=1 Tax=Liquorilactobacillus mali TaxID=1618 RepID=UPI000249191A|nr:hypothetical protein [Liquorilactobacillus mali]EJE98246.1 hypothetical protein LMA_07883 [Liquorilactobacillus mali KCTC 3596 = DSM 20444]MDC7951846.1 hypothetical protein [Liquorilactobacillus mali]MDV7757061.1 hypothetical protein [Liquorilactobacillus mali]QFQ75099.1 hypothetical protein LM596_08180 [Liquorilactobacillus mali]